jgi:hypothetical protein
MKASMAVTALPQDVLATLFAVLKSWADGMDAFRYEMFARRLVAAEHGRPDAVAWAQSWFDEIVAEERQIAEEREREAAFTAARDAAAKAEFKAGRCGNPNYQAFLDTVEHPEQLENNAPYFAWISPLLSRFENTPNLRDMPADERQAIWQQILQAERAANLAPRLKAHAAR